MKGHLAYVKVQSSATTMTAEATTGVGDLVYTITDSAKTIMDLNTKPVVKDAGTITTEAYKVDYLNGAITFSDAIARTITIDGKYITPVEVATADSLSMTVTSEVLETTPFHVNFRTYEAGLISGNASLCRYFVADDLFIDSLLDGEYKIIEYYLDDTNVIRFYALITSKTVDSPIGGLVKGTLDFQITNQIGI